MGRPKKIVEGVGAEPPASEEVKETASEPKPAKQDKALIDVLKERVEILTGQVKDYEKLAVRIDGLGQDLCDFAVVLGKMYGDPIKGELSRIALRHKGDR